MTTGTIIFSLCSIGIVAWAVFAVITADAEFNFDDDEEDVWNTKHVGTDEI